MPGTTLMSIFECEMIKSGLGRRLVVIIIVVIVFVGNFLSENICNDNNIILYVFRKEK